MQLTLPYPPSVNQAYRVFRNRSIMSEAGRQYRRIGHDMIAAQRGAQEALAGFLEVIVELYPKDKRRRDIDNPLKALFDLMTHAGVWLDDSQVKRLHVIMHDAGHDMRGLCRVTVNPTNGS